MPGFIKLHRSLAKWQWYDDHNATRLLVHLLISVNYRDKKWKSLIIKAGSMVLSWHTLSERCGLSVKQCRVAMQKLEDSGEVARKATNKYQVVSLIKWEQMQVEEVKGASKKASKGQADGKQRATTKEREESKEGNKLTLMDRVREFKNSLRPFVGEYDNDLLKDFFEYWTEHGEKDKKFRAEKEKSFSVDRRLKTWVKNQKRFEKEKSSAEKEKTQFLKERYGIN